LVLFQVIDRRIALAHGKLNLGKEPSGLRSKRRKHFMTLNFFFAVDEINARQYLELKDWSYPPLPWPSCQD
jgi:hypothetical protein